MKTALILGCSHAAGSEMHLEPGINMNGYTQQTYGLYNSYSSLIAQQLGYHPMNRAIPGGSNDAMFRVWESFVNPYSKKVKPDLVIACWTGNDRTEIWDYKNSCWQGLAPGKQRFLKAKQDSLFESEYLPDSVDNEQELLTYQKHWVVYQGPWSGRLNKIKNVLALNAMATQENIPVINLDSFASVQEFVWPEYVYRPMDNANEFCMWAATTGFENTKQGHFFTEAHRLYANAVVTKIDTKFRA